MFEKESKMRNKLKQGGIHFFDFLPKGYLITKYTKPACESAAS